MTPTTPAAPTVPASKPAGDKAKNSAHPRNQLREAVETVVFVVTLVLMLKLFVVEAFVIPTGSMAETLYGYQKIQTCPQCGFVFPVNSHDEVEPRKNGERERLVADTCPNCRYRVDLRHTEAPANRSGDRVLVLKPIYHVREPKPGDVVVFKYPESPQIDHTAQNYIKRAKGFGGETLAIHRGDLYATRALTYPDDALYPRPEDPKDLWKPAYMYRNTFGGQNPLAADLFHKSLDSGFGLGDKGFEIVRKPDDQVLASKRIVYDNDHQAKDLKGRVPPRWAGEAGGSWAPDTADEPKAFTHSGATLGWLRYQNLIPTWGDPPQAEPTAIKNFLGYNSGIQENARGQIENQPNLDDDAWVGDLLIECEAQFQTADAELVLELSKGAHRYQARFAGGNVTLVQTGGGDKELASRPSGIKAPGTYKILFANVDSRLRVWVDGSALDFGGKADYPSLEPEVKNGGVEGWTEENDLKAPASIAAKGGVAASHLKLWRDVYYTRSDRDIPTNGTEFFYVQPGHYLCLGDNSARSSDSRNWGTVPERLMLGKAVIVFWPLYPPPNRVGFIK